jgi:ribosomal silencing factor RsfS
LQLSTILKALDHNLIEDVALYDVREKTALFDTVLIATIRSYPQMEACVRYLEEVTAIRGLKWARLDPN